MTLVLSGRVSQRHWHGLLSRLARQSVTAETDFGRFMQHGSVPIGPGPPRCYSSASLGGVEVLGLGVVDDQRVGGLLGVQLELLGEGDPDPLGFEQPHNGRPVGQVRARRVAE